MIRTAAMDPSNVMSPAYDQYSHLSSLVIGQNTVGQLVMSAAGIVFDKLPSVRTANLTMFQSEYSTLLPYSMLVPPTSSRPTCDAVS